MRLETQAQFNLRCGNGAGLPNAEAVENTCQVFQYLKVGDGVRGGQPAGARVLLVAERSVEGLSDGAEVKGTNCRGSNAVTAGEAEAKVL